MLHLFGGPRRASAQSTGELEARGFVVEHWDIADAFPNDVTDEELFGAFLWRVRNSDYVGGILGPPLRTS